MKKYVDPTADEKRAEAIRALGIAAFVAKIMFRIDSESDPPPAGCLPHDFHRAPKADQ